MDEAHYLEQIQRLETQGHWQDAEDLARRLTKAFPDSLFGWLSLSSGLRRRGRNAEAARAKAAAARIPLSTIERPYDRFRAAMILGRFADAFRLAEGLLDGGLDRTPHDAFWNPWGAHPREVEGLAGPAVWRDYYSGAARAFPVARYGWMNVKSGLELINAAKFADAAKVLGLAGRARPVEWRAHGYRAEALLCAGRPAQARAAMARLEPSAPAPQRGQALAWRGELELWQGRYAAAEKTLSAACELNVQHAHCWRAAAVYLRGRKAEALRLLDETIARFPADHEAGVWRGEVLRALGRPREALRALEPLGAPVWAVWNRALALAELGDRAGLRREYLALSPQVRSRLRRRLGAGPDEENDPRALLAAGLKLARGFRRDDYDQRVWLR